MATATYKFTHDAITDPPEWIFLGAREASMNNTGGFNYEGKAEGVYINPLNEIHINTKCTGINGGKFSIEVKVDGKPTIPSKIERVIDNSAASIDDPYPITQ